jgi:hypothetical protein
MKITNIFVETVGIFFLNGTQYLDWYIWALCPWVAIAKQIPMGTLPIGYKITRGVLCLKTCPALAYESDEEKCFV